MPTSRYLNLNETKKKKIESAIIHEMMTHSFEHINISNIVNEASISRGSFYQYFSNKHDFYFYILSSIAQIKGSYFNDHFLEDSNISFINKIKHMLDSSIHFSKENDHFVEIGLRLYASTHKDIKQYFETSYEDMSKLLIQWLQSDKTYHHIKEKESIVDYISNSLIYFTQYALKYHSIDQLEANFRWFIHILEGGLKHV
jgi:AcrR family transcriptional regulator